MKIFRSFCVTTAIVYSKNINQVLEDLTAITSKFDGMTKERGISAVNPELLEEVLIYQTNVLEGKDSI